MITNIGFKARVEEIEKYELKLSKLNPIFHGEDYQTDTYFHVSRGRLKLREGNIENALINYERANTADVKESNILLYKHQPDLILKEILAFQFGIKVVVQKRRRIYFIDNVKFHFDFISSLGSFIEVEAIDEGGKFSIDQLRVKSEYYFHYFELQQSALVAESYSDLLIKLEEG